METKSPAHTAGRDAADRGVTRPGGVLRWLVPAVSVAAIVASGALVVRWMTERFATPENVGLVAAGSASLMFVLVMVIGSLASSAGRRMTLRSAAATPTLDNGRSGLRAWTRRHPMGADLIAGGAAGIDYLGLFVPVVLASQIADALVTGAQVPTIVAYVGLALAIWAFVRQNRPISLRRLSLLLMAIAAGCCVLAAVAIRLTISWLALAALAGAVVCAASTFLLFRLRQRQSPDPSRTAGVMIWPFVGTIASSLLVLGPIADRWGVELALLTVVVLRVAAIAVTWLLPPDAPVVPRRRVGLWEPISLMAKEPGLRAYCALSAISQMALTFAQAYTVLELQASTRGVSVVWVSVATGAAVFAAAPSGWLADRLANRGVRIAYLATFLVQGAGFAVGIMGASLTGIPFLLVATAVLVAGHVGSTQATHLRMSIPEWPPNDDRTSARAAAAQMSGFAFAALGLVGGAVYALAGWSPLMLTGIATCAFGLVVTWRAASLRGLKPPRLVTDGSAAAAETPGHRPLLGEWNAALAPRGLRARLGSMASGHIVVYIGRSPDARSAGAMTWTEFTAARAAVTKLRGSSTLEVHIDDPTCQG